MAIYPDFKTLSDISRYHGQENANGTALIFDGRETTYKQLDSYANQISHGLSSLVEPQQRFAVLAKNNDYFFELLMGAGKCGAVLVGVNWRLAAPEVEYILQDSAASLLFIEEEFIPLLEKIRHQLPRLKKVIVFSEVDGEEYYSQWRDQQAITELEQQVCDSDIAMQLYTSGTTGNPKGVELSHRAILSLREAEHLVADWSQWDNSDVALVAMPLFHIGGTATGLIALYNGAAAVIMAAVDPGEIIGAMKRYKVTRTFLVPAVIQLLLDHASCNAEAFKSLKVLLYGASPIPAALLTQALKVFQCRFAQIYGMTETSGSVTVLHPEDHNDLTAKKMASCGKAYPTVDIAITDQAGNHLSADTVGEIIIRSPSLMKSYWQLPQATNKTIKGGWLYTGDAGYLDDEGYLYIYDRVKDMIVSGGENIYPAEVESVLFEHPDVKDIAVIGVPSKKWGEEVKAVVVTVADSQLQPEQLLAFARDKIAGYKIPKSVDFTEELPRNPSGKLLKREIRKPYWQHLDREVN
jgi:acyl-CoA synthetase (AMP-forming)/AMP-acid ligase II